MPLYCSLFSACHNTVICLMCAIILYSSSGGGGGGGGNLFVLAHRLINDLKTSVNSAKLVTRKKIP